MQIGCLSPSTGSILAFPARERAWKHEHVDYKERVRGSTVMKIL